RSWRHTSSRRSPWSSATGRATPRRCSRVPWTIWSTRAPAACCSPAPNCRSPWPRSPPRPSASTPPRPWPGPASPGTASTPAPEGEAALAWPAPRPRRFATIAPGPRHGKGSHCRRGRRSGRHWPGFVRRGVWMNCPRCGEPLSGREQVCPRCGEQLDAAAGVDRDPAGPAPLRSDPGRRQLTVLFADLVGSTALSERLDPEDLRTVIAAYQKACAAVIERYDGHLAKYLGDGVLAYFGYPRAHEED